MYDVRTGDPDDHAQERGEAHARVPDAGWIQLDSLNVNDKERGRTEFYILISIQCVSGIWTSLNVRI